MIIRHFDTRWVYNRKKKLFELHCRDNSNDVVIAILTWRGTVIDADYWCTFTDPLLGPGDERWHLQAKNVTDAQFEIEHMIVWLAKLGIDKLWSWMKAFSEE
nr:MAG TPA: hypothetical protein [Caudoviricetes sp.]